MQPQLPTLRPTQVADLPFLFRFQLDEEARYLAAFTPPNHADAAAYTARFTRLLADPAIHMQTIMAGDAIVGSIARFELDGVAEITYWLDRRCWGRGLASAALRQFLALEATRPLRARVAAGNPGSQRVLEKCGFRQVGTARGFALARQAGVDEFIYQLAAGPAPTEGPQ